MYSLPLTTQQCLQTQKEKKRMSDNNKEEKKKKNPPPAARAVKRRKKKGPSNAVKIPQGNFVDILPLFSIVHSIATFRSISDIEMQAKTFET